MTMRVVFVIVFITASDTVHTSYWLKFLSEQIKPEDEWGTAAAVQAWQPCLLWVWELCPLVTPYYCRLGDLLWFVFMSFIVMFDLSVYYLFLQYFDTVGWVFDV